MGATSIPVLWSGDLAATLEFYRTLGYEVTSEQFRPYTYATVTREGYEVHFGPTPKGLGIDAERAHVGCLVYVDEVEDLHKDFTAALRGKYGRVPAKGAPRITRFRPGQSRFTVVDPAGNSIIYIRHDEPEIEYFGSKALEGLAKVIDNARNLRDFRNDDKAAARALEAGLGRFGAMSSPVDRGRALAMLVEICIAEGDSDRAAALRRDIADLGLSAEDRAIMAKELRAADDLTEWLTGGE
ncbi:glyoxalase [Nocardia transvalensis]|uniref:glyoxalase n=1 Tax=Nocardia transvalensis TaxID=37333 RepID=UPI001895B9A8|nr:glyoxalase [Nocardia transvalensis]MBF6331405.1 glyoxalase [Nocardia transvalensis]